MNTVDLPKFTIKGDVWSQLINVTMTDQDFTGITATATLMQKSVENTSVVPSVVATPGALGAASLVVTLTGVQTASLAAGNYTVRVRIQLPTWGPYTILAINFTVIV